MSIGKEVIQFVAEQTGEPESRLSIATALWPDLSLAGDDAEEFLVAFSKRFNVDVSNFRLYSYVPGEGADVPIVETWNFLTRIVRWLRPIRYARLTVADLIRAAETKMMVSD